MLTNMLIGQTRKNHSLTVRPMLKGGTHVSENKSVLYREEKGIARVTFNRPEALNAIDKDLLQQLASILDVAKKDEAVKAVIITGAGERPSRLERTLGFSTMPRLLRFGN